MRHCWLFWRCPRKARCRLRNRHYRIPPYGHGFRRATFRSLGRNLGTCSPRRPIPFSGEHPDSGGATWASNTPSLNGAVAAIITVAGNSGGASEREGLLKGRARDAKALHSIAQHGIASRLPAANRAADDTRFADRSDLRRFHEAVASERGDSFRQPKPAQAFSGCLANLTAPPLRA